MAFWHRPYSGPQLKYAREMQFFSKIAPDLVSQPAMIEAFICSFKSACVTNRYRN